MQMFARWRIHIKLIDCSAYSLQQVRPGLQRFRRDAATASFRFARWPPIEQSDAHTAARETLSRERTGRSRANNQDFESIHAAVIIKCFRISCNCPSSATSTETSASSAVNVRLITMRAQLQVCVVQVLKSSRSGKIIFP